MTRATIEVGFQGLCTACMESREVVELPQVEVAIGHGVTNPLRLCKRCLENMLGAFPEEPKSLFCKYCNTNVVDVEGDFCGIQCMNNWDMHSYRRGEQ